MIGVIASILTALLTGNYILLLTPIMYIAALKSRDLALLIFYVYALVIAFSFNPGSIYTLNGIGAVLVALSTMIVLDDILRGVRLGVPSKEELIILGALTASAITVYTFLPTLAAVTFYRAYRAFGRASFYTMGWWLLLAIFLYAGKSRLPHEEAQALVIAGLAFIFILIAERREVESVEVRPFGKK